MSLIHVCGLLAVWFLHCIFSDAKSARRLVYFICATVRCEGSIVRTILASVGMATFEEQEAALKKQVSFL